MKLSIIRIVDRGVQDKERLYLKALNDVNLSSYLVFSTSYSEPAKISAGGKSAYWFPPKRVKAGDSIILYTGTGKPSETKKTDGTTTYFLYWGWKAPLWVATGKCAVVMELADWVTSQYE